MLHFLRLMLVSILLPLIMAAPAPPPIAPELQAYLDGVDRIADEYRAAGVQLGTLTFQLYTNPLVIRQPDFANAVNALAGQIFAVRDHLDDLPSPNAIEDIHDQLENAAKLGNLAAFYLTQFAADHKYDHVADAAEALVAALALWLDGRNKLADRLGVPRTEIPQIPGLPNLPDLPLPDFPNLPNLP